MSKINQMKREIENDINSIKEVLNKDDLDEMKKIHKYMDSKYQSKIDTWGLSQFGWSDNLGFDYDFIGKSSISENLENMIGKLEGYKQDLDLRVYPDGGFKVLDRNEYRYHKKIMKYGPELDSIIEDSLTELINMKKSEQPPFQKGLVEDFYQKYQELKG